MFHHFQSLCSDLNLSWDRWTTPKAKKWLENIFLCVNAHHHLFFPPQYHAKGRSSVSTFGFKYSSMKSSGKIVGNWKTKVSLDSLRIIFNYSSSFFLSFFLRCLTVIEIMLSYTVDFCLLWTRKKNQINEILNDISEEL